MYVGGKVLMVIENSLGFLENICPCPLPTTIFKISAFWGRVAQDLAVPKFLVSKVSNIKQKWRRKTGFAWQLSWFSYFNMPFLRYLNISDVLYQNLFRGIKHQTEMKKKNRNCVTIVMIFFSHSSELNFHLPQTQTRL